MLLFLCLIGLALGAVPPSADHEVKLERGSCPMFWFSFNNRCYKYIASRMTWGNAERYCVSESANLVSIHSVEESNFVHSLIRNFDPFVKRSWIGLTDTHREGRWMWSDGSSVDFVQWAPLQPDNEHDIEHCVHTMLRTELIWNDILCLYPYAFVCKHRTVCR